MGIHCWGLDIPMCHTGILYYIFQINQCWAGYNYEFVVVARWWNTVVVLHKHSSGRETPLWVLSLVLRLWMSLTNYEFPFARVTCEARPAICRWGTAGLDYLLLSSQVSYHCLVLYSYTMCLPFCQKIILFTQQRPWQYRRCWFLLGWYFWEFFSPNEKKWAWLWL